LSRPGEESREAGQPSAGVFDLEVEGETVVVTPTEDLRELEFAEIGVAAEEVLGLLDRGPARNVVVDFRRTDYYGSTALGVFLRLWKRVRSRGRRMAFCNVSAHEEEILRLANLDRLWPVCPSREEALAAVRGPDEAGGP
jgi:anti-anti-sigma factor